MLKEFNELPLEMQSHIISYNPYMQRLSKTYYQSTKSYYYDRYCHLPINKNEFINYVNQYQPQHFAVFVDKGHLFKVFLFQFIDQHQYSVDFLTLSIDLVDVEEYRIMTDYGSFQIDTFTNLIATMGHNFKHHVYYDLSLTINILNKRPCIKINPLYGLEQTKTFFLGVLNKKLNGSDVDTLFSLLTKLNYLIVSYEMDQEKDNDNILSLLYYDINDITFDAMGNAIDDINNIIDLMMNDYNQYDNVILNEMLYIS